MHVDVGALRVNNLPVYYFYIPQKHLNVINISNFDYHLHRPKINVDYQIFIFSIKAHKPLPSLLLVLSLRHQK